MSGSLIPCSCFAILCRAACTFAILDGLVCRVLSFPQDLLEMQYLMQTGKKLNRKENMAKAAMQREGIVRKYALLPCPSARPPHSLVLLTPSRNTLYALLRMRCGRLARAAAEVANVAQRPPRLRRFCARAHCTLRRMPGRSAGALCGACRERDRHWRGCTVAYLVVVPLGVPFGVSGIWPTASTYWTNHASRG